MASGHVTALTGRTHGCTDPQSDVKILLANSEPSTHGTTRKCRNTATICAQRWYDISRDLDWTLSYVEEQDAFPVEWSGTAGVPKEAWQSWEEPFRVSYRDYVMVQREKEAGVAGVREALKRPGIYEKLDPAFCCRISFPHGCTVHGRADGRHDAWPFRAVCSQSALAQHLSVRHA